MNEAMTIYLNINRWETAENEALIRRIDEFLLDYGIRYTGASNIYMPIEKADRDHAVYAACRALREADWLKDKLAYVPIMHMLDRCSMEQIRVDNMKKPSDAKVRYYEEYYQESGTLAHDIVVDEHRRLRDGYISYLLAGKYGIHVSIYEAFAEQPLKKVVSGSRVVGEKGAWKIEGDESDTWNYPLRAPVVPGDILEAETEEGPVPICVNRINYVTGKEFCEEYKNIIKHRKERFKIQD